MHEHVLAAFPGDKAEALGRIEPFHRAGGGAERRAGIARTAVGAVAPTTAAAVSAAATGPRRLRTRFVHRQRATVQVGPVELRDGFFGITVGHFHETEPSRTARVTIRDDAYRFHLASLCKQAVEVVFRRLKRQISYV